MISSNASVSLPLLDQTVTQAIVDDLGDDVTHQLLHLFIQELQQLLHKINIATVEQDNAVITDALHILKNSTALYGASKLAFMANALYEARLLTPLQRFEYAKELMAIGQQTLALYRFHFKSQGTSKDNYE
ncbi:hypothetical protein [Alishewanella tabrizica]|uniref:HPt domain-containing protein n=1 Tax=Alishewanella tabrizica TaxID=671278 RepID=A0ABQ2WLV2_9ALTE|nr:hypothetical protein [Alishewanella tabrizica]GGW61768.1 hypothetical protein GCM10008111_17440 [Alishewanella tabrizica]